MQKLRTLSVCLHLTAAVTYGTTIYCLTRNGLPPAVARFGHFKFITFWNLIVQLVTFSLSLIIDLIQTDTNRFKLIPVVALRDRLFNSLAFPLSAHIAITFWSIYAIDRELIFPVHVEPYWPQWLNHTSHTVILLIVLIENYLVDHRRREEKNGLLLTWTVTISYMFWAIFVKLSTNYWPYPVLSVLNWPSKVAFLGFGTIATTFYYKIEGDLYDMRWRSRVKRDDTFGKLAAH